MLKETITNTETLLNAYTNELYTLRRMEKQATDDVVFAHTQQELVEQKAKVERAKDEYYALIDRIKKL